MSGLTKLTPDKIRVSVARLAADGHNIAGPWYDFLAVTTDLNERLEFIVSAANTGSSAEDEPMEGPVNLQGLTLECELEPEAHFPFLMGYSGAFDTAVLQAGAAWRHRGSPSRGTAYADCLALRWTVNGVTAVILRPVLISEQTVSWSSNNTRPLLRLTVNAERADIVGAASSGTPPAAPYIQGWPTQAELGSVDPTLYLSVIDPVPTAAYDIRLAAKVGAASAYGPGQALLAGEPLRLNDSAGLRLGQAGLYLEAILDDPTGLALNHEWAFPLTRAAWTRALPPRVATTSAMARVYRDGVAYRVTEGSIVLSNPTDFAATGGSRAGDEGVTPSNKRTVRWNLTRIAGLDDKTAQDIRSGGAFGLEVRFETDVVIAGTSIYYEIAGISRRCRPTQGSTINQVNGNTIRHQLVASAHESTDPDFPDPFTWEVVNTIADPLA